MSKLFRLIILTLVYFLIPQSTPISTIQEGLKRVLEINSEFKKKSADLSKEHLNALEIEVEKYIDFSGMAKRSFGSVWKDMDESQQQEAQRLLKKLLTSSYIDKIAKINSESVRLLNESVTGDSAEVSSLVKGEDNKEISIKYRLRNIDKSWKVTDVIIEGVSLTLNYRQEFQNIARKSGVNQVLNSLKQRVGES